MSEVKDWYAPSSPYRQGTLPVDAIHTLYWEECGTPQGLPVVFLHGGPGAGCSPDHRRFFDPTRYRIVLFDQRGAGRSTPHGELKDNTTEHLVSDIEALRKHLGISTWHVFGGSWGSTLALAYAQEHPQSCLSLTLRGIFLMRKSEIDWFLHGMRMLAPDHWQVWVDFLPEALRGDVLEGYWTLLNDADPEKRLAAAYSWALYEAKCVTLRPSAEMRAEVGNPRVATGLARLEAHYMRNNHFEPDDVLLRRIDRIRHLPCTIVQGRQDLVCPPVTAFELHQAWPEAVLEIIDAAGHSASEPGIRAALVACMDRLAAQP